MYILGHEYLGTTRLGFDIVYCTSGIARVCLLRNIDYQKTFPELECDNTCKLIEPSKAIIHMHYCQNDKAHVQRVMIK